MNEIKTKKKRNGKNGKKFDIFLAKKFERRRRKKRKIDERK